MECGLLVDLSGIPAGLGRGSRDSICGALRAKLKERPESDATTVWILNHNHGVHVRTHTRGRRNDC